MSEMSAESLRARILANPIESVEAELLNSLRKLPQIQSAESAWFHGWVEIRVVLSEWTWDAQAAANDLIDTFAREYVQTFSVQSRFVPVEPRRRATTEPVR